MPIRRAAATPSQEKAPSAAPAEKEPVATAEESPSTDEEQAESSAAAPEGEKNAEAAESKPVENGEKADGAEGEKEAEATGKKGDKCKDCEAGQCATHCHVLLLRLKDGYKYEKGKAKKVKRTIPAWASVAASKKLPVTNYAGTQHKVDNILIEAVTSCTDRSGISYQSVMKFILKKYPGMELDRKKFLIKKAMKKHLEKGTIKQLKGKGLSGTFAIGKKPTSTKKTPQKQESLGDALPLIITRLCEPKEASYSLIKKYLEKHFPDFNIERRPDVLKSALVKAVEKGQVEQITGKGATGTFQLKRNNQASQKGGAWDDALNAAITAMNEPKTCSTTSLRKYLLDSNKDAKEYQLVANLRRTLTKCKVLGWMEQISGHGFTGTYQLSFPFYPSPTVLYPDKFKEPSKKNTPAKRWKTSDTSEEDEESEEEEEEEEEESEDEAPVRKKQVQRRPPPKARRPPPAKKPKAKVVARKSPAKKAVAKRMAEKKPAKASPVKKATPARKSESPAVKKTAKRGAKRSSARDTSSDESVKVRETPRRGDKRPKYTDEDENESSDEVEVKEPPRKQAKAPAKKQAAKSVSKPAKLEPKKGAKGGKQSARKRGRN